MVGVKTLLLTCYTPQIHCVSVWCMFDFICIQDSSEDLTFHYWALFDGHAGSGAAVMASRLLHHHIALHLQEVTEIICTPSVQPPTCLGEEPINHHLTPTSQRALTRAASLRGAAGAPGSPSTPPTRFFTEKKVSHESLVVGAIENAFKDMVRDVCSVWSRNLKLVKPLVKKQ